MCVEMDHTAKGYWTQVKASQQYFHYDIPKGTWKMFVHNKKILTKLNQGMQYILWGCDECDIACASSWNNSKCKTLFDYVCFYFNTSISKFS